jgi:hypothetical protein
MKSDGEGVHTQKVSISLHDRALADGSDSNVKMAHRYAAAKALEILKDEPDILIDVCTCKVTKQ